MELEHRCLVGGLYSATRESCHLARRALLECGYWILEGTGQWGAPRVKQSPLCTGMSTLSMSSLMACWFSDALLHSALLGPALELEPCCMLYHALPYGSHALLFVLHGEAYLASVDEV